MSTPRSEIASIESESDRDAADGQGSVLVLVEAEVLRLLAVSAMVDDDCDVRNSVPAASMVTATECQMRYLRMVWGKGALCGGSWRWS